MHFNFTRYEHQSIRSPVATAVFDHQDRMPDASYFSPCMSIAMGPRSTERLLTQLAVIPQPEFAELAGAYGTLRAHDSLSFLPTAGHEARWF
jgi:hypothetical protein